MDTKIDSPVAEAKTQCGPNNFTPRQLGRFQIKTDKNMLEISTDKKANIKLIIKSMWKK